MKEKKDEKGVVSMKQHITSSQMMKVKNVNLAEALNDSLFNTLLNLLNHTTLNEEEREQTLKMMAERVNIGKMIEIVRNNSYESIEIYKQDTDEKEYSEYVSIGSGHIEKIEFFDETICDALWESVVPIINNKHKE
jgi:hypothetical protein